MLVQRTARSLLRSAAGAVVRSQRQVVGSSRCASTLVGLLQERAVDLPWREVVQHSEQEIKWSNSDFREEATALANGLGELGFRPGDTLVTILPNNAENLITTFAAASLGVKVVAVAPASAAELEAVLATSGAKALVYDPAAQATVAQLLPDTTAKQVFVHDIDRVDNPKFPNLSLVITTAWDPTDNSVVNFRHLLMRDAELRCHVKRSAGAVAAGTPLVGGATNQDLLAAADRVVNKLRLTGTTALTVEATDPRAIAIAGAAALKSNAILTLGSVPNGMTNVAVLNDAILA